MSQYLIVTGAISPTIDGTYTWNGLRWRNGMYEIWQSSGVWNIGIYGTLLIYFTKIGGSDPTGTYYPSAGSSGTPVAVFFVEPPGDTPLPPLPPGGGDGGDVTPEPLPPVGEVTTESAKAVSGVVYDSYREY
jgi:hypothetical protein